MRVNMMDVPRGDMAAWRAIMHYHDDSCPLWQSGSLISRIGAYQPPVRKGYDTNRRELSISKKVSKRLYSARVELARALVRNAGISDDIRAVARMSVVECGLSPHSLIGWADYIAMLSDHYPRGEFFLHLEQELVLYDSVRRHVRVSNLHKAGAWSPVAVAAGMVTAGLLGVVSWQVSVVVAAMCVLVAIALYGVVFSRSKDSGFGHADLVPVIIGDEKPYRVATIADTVGYR